MRIFPAFSESNNFTPARRTLFDIYDFHSSFNDMKEERMLRRIFGLKKENVATGQRTFRNEELHHFYPSPNICYGDQIKEEGMVSACSTHESDEKCIQNFSRKI
jgi:hypothetical protein